MGEDALGENESSEANAFRPFSSSPDTIPATSATLRSADGFIGFRSRPRHDARAERNIANAAKSVCDGVQKIVLAAKAKKDSQGAWKQDLLVLLGSVPPPAAIEDGEEPAMADIDTLLEYAQHEKFVLRCVENELPPNLVHCLRLLRVLELQHASGEVENANESQVTKHDSVENEEGTADEAMEKEDQHQEEENPVGEIESDTSSAVLQPIGLVATQKVSKLLCQLCRDPSVGEQLRPHLFGLFALSGASYPPSGLHVALAASDVIVAFSEHCLNRQLVWFIHDRKMILHMTDDVRELCGLSESDSATPAVPMGLVGPEAEKNGLWVVALRTLIKLVYFSCRHQSVELVKDLEGAGGDKVLYQAIKKSTPPHAKELMELLPILACCPDVMVENLTDEVAQLATNRKGLQIFEMLQVESNLVLQEYRRTHKSKRPNPLAEGSLPLLASLSLKTVARIRNGEIEPNEHLKFDVASELLEITLQMFSDHPDNYDRIEGSLHVLSFYLIAFPCFDDDGLKTFILKTLEFVLTGVGVADEVTPMNACVEIFFAMCHMLMNSKEFITDAEESVRSDAVQRLANDAELIGSSLEKLLQFDQRVAPLMVESGILTTNLKTVLDLVEMLKSTTKPEKALCCGSTPLDQTFVTVCEVLKYLVAYQPTGVSKRTPGIAEESDALSNLYRLLHCAMFDLGLDGCRSAASVFEAFLSSFANYEELKRDMLFVLDLVSELGEAAVATDDIAVKVAAAERGTILFGMLRSVLEARSVARDAFRECAGFQGMIRFLSSYQGSVSDSSPVELARKVARLIQTIIGVVGASIGSKSRNSTTAGEVATLTLALDVVIDPLSSRFSSRSPAAINCNFLRQSRFYLDFAASIAGVGILATDNSRDIFDMCFEHIDPALNLGTKHSDLVNLRNPDGVRLILGISAFAVSMDMECKLGAQALDTLLIFCQSDRKASTLSQLASCGLCSSLTNPKEFAPLLFDSGNILQPKFLELLRCLASFRMSYYDFISVLRCAAGPIVGAGDPSGRVRLPVLSSSISRKNGPDKSVFDGSEEDVKSWARLDFMSKIACDEDTTPRFKVGGDSINTIAVLLHKVPLEDRLRAASEQGRLKYFEIDCIDASAHTSADTESAQSSVAGSAATGDVVWTPLTASGFSYSVWLRHEVDSDDGVSGNLYLLDISSPTVSSASATANQASAFLSVWYDMQNQRFNVMSSASYRGEPTCFPVSPLIPNVWHHILITYTPAKRASMLSRKASFSIFVDGRPLEADVRVESVNLPPNSRAIVGAPNAALAVSGIIRGRLPVWDFGPTVMFSTVLLELDATTIFAYGPRFPSPMWGDRPQRQSLSATSTVLFTMLAESGEIGSVASALRRRDISKLETAANATLGHADKDSLSLMALLCSFPVECVVFAFQAGSTSFKMRGDVSRATVCHVSERMVNLARLDFGSQSVSTDGTLHGKCCVVAPFGFADNLQWAGGPFLLFPLVYKTKSSRSLAGALRILNQSTKVHQPNLEMMQAMGGYRMLAVLLREKPVLDERCLDECVACAIHGYNADKINSLSGLDADAKKERPFDNWVLADLDAMKHILLNHQVWDLKKRGPGVSLRLLHILNHLVGQSSVHKAFNARRLHAIGVVRWALHIMIEASDLFTAATTGSQGLLGWKYQAPTIADVSVGGDPGNSFLHQSKTLLRRVLTFMLTPQDLEALTEGIVYTVSTTGTSTKPVDAVLDVNERMLPVPTMRLYLVRLLEELIVDGVNEIVSSAPSSPTKKESVLENTAQPHAAGVASLDQPYLHIPSLRGKSRDGTLNPKDQQAQAFLSAFAGYLTPVWFATLLEGCREEATASAILRLMVLMLQGSSTFEMAFRGTGAFAPFVLSIPRFSTSPSIAITMLSQLLNVPILHLHSLPTLDPGQLCEIFDAESCDDSKSTVWHDYSDPTGGIFGLVAEVLGRNIQLISSDSDGKEKARDTNRAVFELLARRHQKSSSFRRYCSTASFLEPLSQALCLVFDETLQRSRSIRPKHRCLLADVPRDLTPTERFAGGPIEAETNGMGMVRLLRLVLQEAILCGPQAAGIVKVIFRAFPIHASPRQVEAFHLVVIEQCRVVVGEAIEAGDNMSLANCIGVTTVLLDHQACGFLTSEAVLESVKLSVFVLNSLIESQANAVRALSNADQNMLIANAAYFARLNCAVSLRLSLPTGSQDPGDDDLQSEVLSILDSNIDDLFLIPSRDRRSKRRMPSSTPSKPSAGSRNFPLWESINVARFAAQKLASFPDLGEANDSETVAIAPLLVCLHKLLVESRDDVRTLSISVLVSLLQHRPNVMSELLVAEIFIGGQIETVDVVNRGGFRALLVAHESAAIADSTGSSSSSAKRKYAAFFEWLERNQEQVELVFKTVDEKALRMLPSLERASLSQPDAVEREQKLMLMKLTSQGDRTILGAIERTELVRRCAERTLESHQSWRRQGVDDLAAGAIGWKVILRQLKGSFSIWEACRDSGTIDFSLSTYLHSMGNPEQSGALQHESALRWKLDLTEGYERQRRRLLPNYEFHDVYNLDEASESQAVHEDKGATVDEIEVLPFEPASSEFMVEATAELLKDLNLKRTHNAADDLEEEDEVFEGLTISTEHENSTAATESGSYLSVDGEDSTDKPGEGEVLSGNPNVYEMDGPEDSSSYELIHGLLQTGDWPERSYNVRRCTGLEVSKALLLWTTNAMYVIDGFEQNDGGDQTKIMRVEKEQSSFYINLRPKNYVPSDIETPIEEAPSHPSKGEATSRVTHRQQSRARSAQLSDTPDDVIYQHRSQRIPFSELYCVYRRRYQLQQNALEFYDRNNNATLIAFDNHKNREEVLSKVLQSKLPNSVFNSSYGTFISYSKFMSNWKAKVIADWRLGKLSNFDFLMHLNSFAGRSFNDLTQYPIFPWIIADYDSDEIDLDDPNVYRDLSKPMGAIGAERAQQFQDRYEALASCCTDEDPPPFHYGTHYSCAAYVLYYLMRLEPFSRLALALQGGKFDVADRLFHDVGRSWKSASTENLQDVRELIPEFFYLPDLFVNANGFDFGQTQAGKSVHDVLLPKWAKGDPKRFVRINRQALESPYVCRHLHRWADLIFGFKQRGPEAVRCLNQFVHLTYEGEVDLDTMTDPVQRASTIAQIQNFGQTPSRLERRPFPERSVIEARKDNTIDFAVLPGLARMSAPFCLVGAPHTIRLSPVLTESLQLGMAGQMDRAIGDIALTKGLAIGTGRFCSINMTSKKYFRYGGINGGLSVYAAAVSSRQREANKLLSIHDAMHRAPIATAKTSVNGDWIITGCVDSTVRVWRYDENKMMLSATLTGHDGWPIKAVDLSEECGVIATACEQGRVLLWDLRTLTYVRSLREGSYNNAYGSVAVAINHRAGSILVLVGPELTLFDINGNMLASHSFSATTDVPTCAIATDCPEWMEHGAVAVTGHLSGEVRLWSIDFDESRLRLRHTIDENPHLDPITVIRATGTDRQDTLLVGDAAGKMSVHRTVLLDTFSKEELDAIMDKEMDPLASPCK